VIVKGKKADESVTRYLTLAGRDGEHYRTALEPLDKAEAEMAAVEAARKRLEEKKDSGRPLPVWSLWEFRVYGLNLGLLMRHLTGVGTPQRLQGRVRAHR
jgi:hypothetical protein